MKTGELMNIKNSFTVNGARTNNLKSLNVAIRKNSIIAITGISGGGKSSLAYGTLYAICRQQFKQLESGSFDQVNYRVDSFDGSLPAIAVAQHNFNSNPKSTVYSYIDIPSYLYSVSPDHNNRIFHPSLKLNKPGNECPSCQGARQSWCLYEELIFDRFTALKNNPFKCWSGANSEKNAALLRAFCEDEGINLQQPISELSAEHKHKVLNGESLKKFRISYSVGGKRRSREERYTGPVKELSSYAKSEKISLRDAFRKFSKSSACNACDSTGVNPSLYQESLISGINLFDFLRTPISEIIFQIKACGQAQSAAIHALVSQLIILNDLGLGYITLSRQIPTLSGGELQRLRFGKICNTSISGVMFVLDEISSQVSPDAHPKIIRNIKNICANGNTVVMIEHNDHFIRSADQVICIGPSAGDQGGYIIPYVAPADCALPEMRKLDEFEMLDLPTVSKNNVSGVSAAIPLRSVTGICGISGSGKSSFATALSEAMQNVHYVSQKQIRGNVRSTVATALDLTASVAAIFSKETGFGIELFLPQPGKPGCCKLCGGTGVIDYAKTFEKNIKIICTECEGELFSKAVDSLLIRKLNLNVKQLYALPFHSFPKEVVEQSRKLQTVIKIADALGVGHLSLNRKVGSLSGGESRRIKLLQALISPNKDRILIVDEPGSGLDGVSAARVINYIKQCAKNFKAVLIIEHKQEMLDYCDYLIAFGPGAGPNGGKITFTGSPSKERYF